MQVSDTIFITLMCSIPICNNQLNDQMIHIKWANETRQTRAFGFNTLK